MKLRVTVLTLCIMLLASTAFVPNIFLASIPQVEVTRLTQTIYNQYLSCSGSVEQQKKSDVMLKVPVVLSRIEVEVGDFVSKGQRLAVVDKRATVSAFSSLDFAAAASLLGGGLTGIPSELLEGFVNSGGSTLSEFYEQNKDAIASVPDVLTAPESGVITAINADEQTLSSALVPIITIAKTGSLVARVAVSEANISKVKAGQKAVLSILANSGAVYNAVVTKIYPTANRPLLSSGSDATVDVILKINNADEILKPGYSVKAKIAVQESRAAFILPYEAIGQDEDQNEYVYVYSAGHAYKRVIETGDELMQGMEVTGGLLENELVVTNPNQISGEERLVRLLAEGG